MEVIRYLAAFLNMANTKLVYPMYNTKYNTTENTIQSTKILQL